MAYDLGELLGVGRSLWEEPARRRGAHLHTVADFIRRESSFEESDDFSAVRIDIRNTSGADAHRKNVAEFVDPVD